MLSQERQIRRLGISAVPPGWTLTTVGKACTIRNELRRPLAVEVRNGMKGPYPYYGPTGVLGFITEYRVEGDFALIGEDGDHFLDTESKPQTLRVSGQFNVNNHAHVIGSSSTCDVDWFFYFFQYRDIFHSLTRQGAGRFKLTKAALEKLPILLPSLSEQRRIAEILGAWDEAIAKCDGLISAKKAVFARYSASLLTGHQRSKQHCTNWKSVFLTDVTTELTVRNSSQLGTSAVMGVNKIEGMIPMKEHVRAADISRYKIVPPNAFAYNPMRLNIGSIAKNEHGRDVLVSPDYVAFRTNRGELDSGFFDHLRRTRPWTRFVEGAGSGGVRVRIYFDDLSDFSFELPPLEEQRKIVAMLDAARREIQLLEDRRGAFDAQKRGLMQKLLTGEWRVDSGDRHG
jgi:type I restriction enzyme S subunit